MKQCITSRVIHRAIGWALAALLGAPAAAQTPRQINEAEYADRIAAMWRTQVLANWTGLRTEGARREPPFYTDADWQVSGSPPFDLVFQNPWRADDDTDIEYVYLHLAHTLGRVEFTPMEMLDAWVEHINRRIFVSNLRARELMELGILPPSTSLGASNQYGLYIDAQLTTEFFGAFAPGMPTRALELADLPIRTTARGHAMHAAQFFVLLYSYAPVVPIELSRREQIMWMVEQSRAHLPDTSVASDVIDFVVADFLANPDVDDWERTRDLVADRFQVNDAANGYKYRNWFESTVNLAGGLIALLYGDGDVVRTIRIGTLSGWDSDNGTATMGGLIGLLLGTDEVQAQISAYDPGAPVLSDRYRWSSTRDGLIDYLPDDTSAEDSFTLMAERTLPLVRAEVLQAGGLVDTETGRWLLPPNLTEPPLSVSPSQRLADRSANARETEAGRAPTVTHNAGNPSPTQGFSTGDGNVAANGHEASNAGRTVFWPYSEERAFSTQNGSLLPGDTFTIDIEYQQPVEASVVQLIEGTAARTPGVDGGWIDDAEIWLRIGGQWVHQVGAVASLQQQPGVLYEIIDYALPSTVQADGVRLVGRVGGPLGFATITELDVLSEPVAVQRPALAQVFDVNSDGQVDADDVRAVTRSPIDLDGDGVAGRGDAAYLEAFVRWTEAEDMALDRR